MNEQQTIGHAVSRAWAAGADEVLVVDGGSCDDTANLAEREGAVVVLAQAGRASQQNAGARRAKADVLVFQHADNWLCADALDQVRGVMNRPAVSGGGFRQRIEASGWRYRLLESGNASRVRWSGLAYGDQAIFLRRTLFTELGGFPEVPVMEDLLLMRQVRRRGRVVLLPGPLHVSARRWERQGVIRQTVRNWALLAGLASGVPLERLAYYYRRHDRDRPETANGR